MTATIGVNSYVDVAEADAYFSATFDNPGWSAITDKDGALVSARQQLDNMCQWFGYPSVDGQALAFPRLPDADPVPQVVKDAQCEIALQIGTQGSTSTDSGDPLEELKAGSVTLKFKTSGGSSNPLQTDLITSLLKQYGLCQGGGSTRLVPIMRQ